MTYVHIIDILYLMNQRAIISNLKLCLSANDYKKYNIIDKRIQNKIMKHMEKVNV